MSAETSNFQVTTARSAINLNDSIPRERKISDIDARIRKISVALLVVAAAIIVVAKLVLPVGISYGVYCAFIFINGGTFFAVYRSNNPQIAAVKIEQSQSSQSVESQLLPLSIVKKIN